MKLEEYLTSLRGRTVAVIGVGVSNQPLIELLLSHGIAVTACDKKTSLGPLGEDLARKGCRLQLGEGYLRDLTENVIFRTPGMRPDLPELTAAVGRGSILTSEMEAFFEVCPCPITAVTGSDGKTTTTTIIAELLRAAGRAVHLGGNIGRPLLAEAGGMKETDIAVLELSSFQLMTMTRSPHIAVVTNLAPNHLDVHKDYAEYIAAKENIFTHQSPEDIAVFNAGNEVTRSFFGREKGKALAFSRRGAVERGAYLDASEEGQAIWMADEKGSRPVLPLSGIKLPGVHNVENYMAAICAVNGQVPDGIIRDFAGRFGGVEHRIELVRELDGVRYYNDSIASSPSRTIAGLNSFPEKVVLIAGGKDKGISYDSLGPVVNDHVKLLILCGATAGVIRASVEQAENYRGLEIVDVEDYHQAVSLARARTAPGDVVILSPASTSFDRFANFMERGRVFKEIVGALK